MVFAYKEMYGDGRSSEINEADFLDNWDELPIEDVESNLTLLGATGVDDLLQDNVAKCIGDFRDANIKVWMLTGDKGLTAKQIGKSCGLIT